MKKKIQKKKLTKERRGGVRKGAGRKAVLEQPVKVLVTFEKKQVGLVDHYMHEQELPSRSATVRYIVNEKFGVKESDNARNECGIPKRPDPNGLPV